MSRLPPKPLEGLTVLERGWLSSNNVLLHGADADEGAVLVDSGHCTHAAQTVALVRRALGHGADGAGPNPSGATLCRDGRPEALRRLVNTHLHSDHCGGNAALQAAFTGLPVEVPSGSFGAARDWDEAALSYRPTGQRCVRFEVHGALQPGSIVAVGGRRWDVIAAAGHDPDAVMLFDAQAGVLISADALWGNGFGVVFPELEGERAFEDAGLTLDTIERLQPAWVIPGHGAAFDDVGPALDRARRRLESWQSDPARHARHGARVLIKYHLMEERSLPWEAALDWAEATPLMRSIWSRIGEREDPQLRDWAARLMTELVGSGALARIDGQLCDV